MDLFLNLLIFLVLNIIDVKNNPSYEIYTGMDLALFFDYKNNMHNWILIIYRLRFYILIRLRVKKLKLLTRLAS